MGTPRAGYEIAKRVVDVTVATVALVLGAPLAALAALRIKAEDGGPVLYRGTRVGRDGRHFGMFKFRSMVVDAARLGGPSTADDDPRLTRAGRFLRRWKLDELPQLLNVVRGEMSLVGPRPQVASDVARYTAAERGLLSVRPGVTDWASVLFRNEGDILAGHADPDRAYDELIRPRKIELGLRYVASRGLWTDARILWLTARVLVRPGRADALLARAVPGESAAPGRTRFRAITETARMRADADQLAMAELRYSLVAALAKGRDLLDVACGSGYALPLLAKEARSVTGCDVDPVNVRDARAALPTGRFVVADAQHLPLPDRSFDVIACLEAIYYLPDWAAFLGEARRLLRPGGTLVVTWPNPARPAFHRSPNSTSYPGAEEMLAVAEQTGLSAVCFGAFPIDGLATARRPGLDALRRAVVRLHLIPRSLRLRSFVKRVLYRRLTPLSALRLAGDPFERLVKITPGVPADFAMLYLVADDGEKAQVRS